MKKILIVLTVIAVVVYLLATCRFHHSIPPNSIYEEGDVVYEIDSIASGNKTTPVAGYLSVDNIFIIYRQKHHEIIMSKGGPTDETVYPIQEIHDNEYISKDDEGSILASFVIQSENIYFTVEHDKSRLHIASIVNY